MSALKCAFAVAALIIGITSAEYYNSNSYLRDDSLGDGNFNIKQELLAAAEQPSIKPIDHRSSFSNVNYPENRAEILVHRPAPLIIRQPPTKVVVHHPPYIVKPAPVIFHKPAAIVLRKTDFRDIPRSVKVEPTYVNVVKTPSTRYYVNDDRLQGNLNVDQLTQMTDLENSQSPASESAAASYPVSYIQNSPNQSTPIRNRNQIFRTFHGFH